MSNDNNKKVKHGQTRKTSRRYALLGVCGLSNTCMWPVARRQLQQLILETTKAWVGAEGGGGALGVGIAGEVGVLWLCH